MFRDPAEVDQIDDRVVVQTLGDRTGCAVLLPDACSLWPVMLREMPDAESPDAGSSYSLSFWSRRDSSCSARKGVERNP